MRTTKADMKKLLPHFMRDDEFVNALAEAINDIFGRVDLAKLRTWDQLEKMNDAELDELAWELNVLWYNSAGTLKQKREQIRAADDVWRTLGTKHAIETVVGQLFLRGKVSEFWDAGLSPHRFSVEVYAAETLTAASEKEFRRIIEIVKRKSQILDSIKLILVPEFATYNGVVICDITTEKHTFTR